MPGAGHADHVPAHRELRVQWWRRTTVHHIATGLSSDKQTQHSHGEARPALSQRHIMWATNVILFLKLYRIGFLFFPSYGAQFQEF